MAKVPGTTLGLLRVPGLPLGPKNRAFDTPGIPNERQLVKYLDLNDFKVVFPTKRMKPRTYRILSEMSILIGGVARLDVLEIPGRTIYITVYVSNDITLHMGKTAEAEAKRVKHAGVLLTPPSNREKAKEALLPLICEDVQVEGLDWTKSTADITIAGLGWLAIGCKGIAKIAVWTPPNVAVATRTAMIQQYNKHFEKQGFSQINLSSRKQ